MKKRLLVAMALLIAVSTVAVAPISASVLCCTTYARGDYQILSNDASGAVVRVWVGNNCRIGRFVLVTVVANATGGGTIQGAYTVWVPCFGTRPVDVHIGAQIDSVNKQIATALGAL